MENVEQLQGNTVAAEISPINTRYPAKWRRSHFGQISAIDRRHRRCQDAGLIGVDGGDGAHQRHHQALAFVRFVSAHLLALVLLN